MILSPPPPERESMPEFFTSDDGYQFYIADYSEDGEAKNTDFGDATPSDEVLQDTPFISVGITDADGVIHYYDLPGPFDDIADIADAVDDLGDIYGFDAG